MTRPGFWARVLTYLGAANEWGYDYTSQPFPDEPGARLERRMGNVYGMPAYGNDTYTVRLTEDGRFKVRKDGRS